MISRCGHDAKRTDVGLGSKVHYGVDFLVIHDVVNKVRRSHVALDKLVVGIVTHFHLHIFNAGAIIQFIKVDDFVVRVIFHQANHDMGSAIELKRGLGSANLKRGNKAGSRENSRASSWTLLLRNALT